MPDHRAAQLRRLLRAPRPRRAALRAVLSHHVVRRLIAANVLVAAAAAGAVGGAHAWVVRASSPYLYAPADVPVRPVALVLGALEVDGKPSPFLAARLDVARGLFARGKVHAILISGDNGRPGYDEPTSGKNYLVEHGVPASAIALDYAGFDTYDSCTRARKVFGVQHLTVVTQSYHLPRAVALCRSVGIDAVGTGTSAHEDTAHGVVASNRELLASVKAVLDVAGERDPVFLGPPEPGVRMALAHR